jgi:hypothetical protein
MTGAAEVASGAALDEESIVALREILDDPSRPAGTMAAGRDGVRLARLREALDQLVMVRAGAGVIRWPEAGEQLLASLAALDSELAGVLREHVAAVEFLSALEPGPARNAVLGDVARGDLIAFASSVRDWSWGDGRTPSPVRPLQTARGVVEIDEFPAFYDTLLARDERIGGMIAIPTVLQGVSWAPLDPDIATGKPWVVTVAGSAFHADDLILLDCDPRGPGL